MKLKLGYLLVALLVMLVMCRSKHGREGFGNGTTPAFSLYHVDWCGHCKRAKPEFKKLDDTTRWTATSGSWCGRWTARTRPTRLR